jgi:hypothetical protein
MHERLEALAQDMTIQDAALLAFECRALAELYNTMHQKYDDDLKSEHAKNFKTHRGIDISKLKKPQ